MLSAPKISKALPKKRTKQKATTFELSDFGLGEDEGSTSTIVNFQSRSADGRRIVSRPQTGPTLSPQKPKATTAAQVDLTNFTYDFAQQLAGGSRKTLRVKKVKLTRKKRYASSVSRRIFS